MILNVVIGPMFAGKSTFIINKVEGLQDKYLAIKPLIDDRYSSDEIVSHDKKKINAISVPNLYDFINDTDLDSYNNIFIDEAQFFNDIQETIQFLEYNFKGNVYVCGLNADFKRKPIGYINNIISRADDIIFLKGQCFNCPEKSIFSLKIVADENQIDVGGEEKYRPVCGKCYQYFSKTFYSHESFEDND